MMRGAQPQMDNLNFAIRKSIRNKINSQLTISIILVNVFITDYFIKRNSETMLRESCEAQLQSVNSQLRLVEQSVNNIYHISEGVRPPASELRSAWRVRLFLHEFTNTALKIAENTDGVMSVYYFVEPTLSSNTRLGFFYVKSPETGEFEETILTDITAYEPDDVEHVGWYYTPVNAGEAVWMDRYYNDNVGVEMISYIVPVYEGDILIGLIGMDIAFDSILEKAEDIAVYQTGGVVLASVDSEAIYYKENNVFGDKLSDEMLVTIKNNDKSGELEYFNTIDGKYAYEFNTLRNNMKLIMYAKVADIESQKTMVIIYSGLILIGFLIITIFTSARMIRHIKETIIKITADTKSFAEGDWDAKVSCNTNDELQILTENITVMAKKTKEYIQYINDMALKDELTGLRKKTAYRQYVDQISVEYSTQDKDYAVLVCDVNNLKTINDNYGHEEGDKMIVAASKVICKTFAHSPVFRIGGDEFVVILDSEDYYNREVLVHDFMEVMSKKGDTLDSGSPTIAIGMATLGTDGESYEELFEKADQNMYANKTKLKNGKDVR